ncbi:MAG: elongation factor EF-2 [DPANN group archaeon]|nr:elongation factor EF-2 [DPANN group archaeon]
MAVAKSTVEKIHELMKNSDNIRNIGTIAHIDHGKTTLSDNLIAGAGMMSEELAGEQRVLDYDPQEAARGITINAANISMIYNYNNTDFLINLIDTPGHVDFSGEVTRAMRAIDCALVLVDAVEGIMPQTETVLRQSLKEGVKPVLFINKVDRLIKELKLPPEKMQERFIAIIADVNRIIESLAPKQFKQLWQVQVQNGSVCFGSAKHRWALSVPMMKKKNITLKDVIAAYQGGDDDYRTLGRSATLHEAVLDMVIQHGPSPKKAQEYRIPIIWKGELESETGKELLAGNPSSETIFVVTKVTIDPQAGEVFTGRVFSGTLKKGQELYLNTAKSKERVQQVTIYKGATRLLIEDAPAGNIVGVVGLRNAGSGETCSEKEVTPFESIKHLFDPVVTVAIEPKNPQDLPKLIDVLKGVAKQDPTVAISINEETGENLFSGLGELHIEIWMYRIKNDKGIEIVTSPPIVVYREAITKKFGPVEGKSPNRHNKLYVTAEPLDKPIYDLLKSGTIPDGKMKKNKNEVVAALIEAGMDKDEAKSVIYTHNGNVLVEATRGQVHLNEIIEMVMEGFKLTMQSGPIVKEPCIGLKITINDAKLHEDSIHRGPGQMIPCSRQAISNAMLSSGVVLFEPVQTIRLDTPAEYLNAVTKLIVGRRGQLLETAQEGDHATIKAKVPVGEMFGFTSALRSGTSGRGAWFLSDQDFEKLPNSLQSDIVGKLRKRKGLPIDLPRPILD